MAWNPCVYMVLAIHWVRVPLMLCRLLRSEVEVLLGKQVVNFTVEDTGHFQNFKDRTIGQFKIHEPGVYTLRINAKKKAKAAIMDVRQIRLVRASN